MNSASTGFDTHCLDIATRFLQTVVVVDNEAFFGEPQPVHGQEVPADGVKTPLSGLTDAAQPGPEDAPEGGVPADQAVPRPVSPACGDTKNRGLDARILTERFADKHIACTVYRPLDTDDPVVRTMSLARRADILVVDWQLGKGSSKAKDIIAKTLIQDHNAGGRLRLIAVYTADGKLSDLVTELEEAIRVTWQGAPQFERGLGGDCSLAYAQTRVVFLCKEHATRIMEGVVPVREDELPDRLVREFARLSNGLLPGLALQSVAAIREATNHLLAVFHRGLDGCLVAHRSLLPDPEDAEAFCLDLMISELRTILEASDVGRRSANSSILTAWINSMAGAPGRLPERGDLFLQTSQIGMLVTRGVGEKEAGFKDALKAMQMNWVEAMVLNGESFRDRKNSALDVARVRELAQQDDFREHVKGFSQDVGPKWLPRLFFSDDVAAERANLEFSRLTSLKRESFGRQYSSDWTPTLTLGSILRRQGSDEYLLCVQARCDSARLSGATRFPFLLFKAVPSGKFNFVVRRDNGDDQRLRLEEKPFLLEVHSFAPLGAKEQSVRARKEGGLYLFTANAEGGETPVFHWIADLKDSFAQRVVHVLAERMGSVGLDEYEWMRRSGK